MRILDAETHDRVFAAVSHLPHLLAYALVGQLACRPNTDQLFDYAAAGFRDFTRIAASHPEMWRDISLANRTALLAELDRYGAALMRIRQALVNSDGEALASIYANARDARQQPVSLMNHLPFLDLPAILSAGGTVRLPGSKSLSNCILLLAALAEGETEVRDVSLMTRIVCLRHWPS